MPSFMYMQLLNDENLEGVHSSSGIFFNLIKKKETRLTGDQTDVTPERTLHRNCPKESLGNVWIVGQGQQDNALRLHYSCHSARNNGISEVS